MRRLFCRKCGYDLTPLFQGDVVEAPCPECGSLADKRPASANSSWWWRQPALLSISAGTIPVLLGLAAAAVLLPFAIPGGAAVCAVVAFFLIPKDVPGRANFGRLWPFLILVSLASVVVNFGFAVFCLFAMTWVSN